MDEKLARAYRTLAIAPDASDEAVKRAFHSQAWACHPDLHPGSAAHEEAFQVLEAAYAAVRDARRRERAASASTNPEAPVRLHNRMTLLSEIPEGIVVWCMEDALQVEDDGSCRLRTGSRFWRAPRNGVRLAVLRTSTGWQVATPDRWQMQWRSVRTFAPDAVPVERFVVGTLAPSREDLVYQFVGSPEYDVRQPGIVPAWLIDRGPRHSVGK